MCLAKRVKANGKLDKTALADAAETFGRKKGGVRMLWSKHKSAIVSPGKFKLDVKHKKGAGPPRKMKLLDIQQKVKKCHSNTIRLCGPSLLKLISQQQPCIDL